MTEIGHSERLCLEHERDKPGTVRGHTGNNRECEAQARCQEAGVLENGRKKIPPQGISGGEAPGNKEAVLSPGSLQSHLLEPQRKSPGATGCLAEDVVERIAGAVPHKRQLRTCPFSERWLSSESLPRGLRITGLSSHQGRSCWSMAVTLPLATTLHCIPGEGRAEHLRVGTDTPDLCRMPLVPYRRVVTRPLPGNPH